MDDFVFSEFASLDLGDKRLDERLRSHLSNMLASPGASVQASCKGWAETSAAYRLFNNGKVRASSILNPHRQGLLERAREHSCIALIQDTTELDYSGHRAMEHGVLGSETRRGFYLHGSYVVSESRVPLGLWDYSLLEREGIDGYDPSRPIEDKETYRWVLGMRQAHELAERLPGKEVFCVGDRESDVYEVLREALSPPEGQIGAHLLVRSNLTRSVSSLKPCGDAGPIDGLQGPLNEVAGHARALGCVEYTIPARKGFKKAGNQLKPFSYKSRRVRQQLKACEVVVAPPSRHRKGVKMRSLRLWLVLAEEVDPPADLEGEPLFWALLTTYPVECFEAASRIVNLYAGRWDIEVFHRVLKTGCKVERLRFKRRAAFEPALVCKMIVAWRLQYLVRFGRACPDLPCSACFAEEEWRAALAIDRKVADPKSLKEPTLGELLMVIARFGGHLGRKNDAPPGAQCMWTGLARVRDFAIAIEICLSP